jgi:hypothetical protein
MASQGVVFLALGDRIYGRMAFNACLSIKANCPHLKTAILYEESAVVDLKPAHWRMFDTKSVCPTEYYIYDNKKSYFRAKTRLYDFTPFDKTLWLDADTIIHTGKGSEIMAIFDSDKDYCAQTYNLLNCDTGKRIVESTFPDNLWHPLNNSLVEKYELQGKVLPQINSSFMYFVKNERMKDFFDEVKRLWAQGINAVRTWRQDFPDEFFFHIAGARLGVQTDPVPFVPLYGDHEFKVAYNGWIGAEAVQTRHIGTMLYGLNPPNHIVSIYNNLVKRYHETVRPFNKIEPFNHVSKTKVGIRD